MLRWVLIALTALLAVATLLPLSRKTVWWVRGADFPRLQFALLGVLLLAAFLLTQDRSLLGNRMALGVIVACLAHQAWWILPYTVVFPREVKPARRGGAADTLRILSVNILMDNRRADELVQLVGEHRPDVLITLETNRWWEEQLKPLEAEYPHSLKCPLENAYGMHLYSRLPIEDSKIQFLVEEDVPSMHLLLRLSSGRRVRLHCLHPAPPSPTENERSTQRDAELVMVGRSVAGAKLPVVVTGDLNDVGWSATTRLFRKVSGLLDPRIGRGMYNTFHAGHLFMRWPVDHFFHSRHFTLGRLTRLRAVGSDHFPVLIDLVLDEEAKSDQRGLPANESAHEEAEKTMKRESVSGAEVHRPGEGSQAENRAQKNGAQM